MHKFTISKEFTFDSAHQLTGLKEGHKCMRLHGHTYTLIVELSADRLNQHGFVIDYNDLQPIKDYIDNHLDHRNLNDISGLTFVTAEYIAIFLYAEFRVDFPQLSAISIKETAKTLARYEP